MLPSRRPQPQRSTLRFVPGQGFTPSNAASVALSPIPQGQNTTSTQAQIQYPQIIAIESDDVTTVTAPALVAGGSALIQIVVSHDMLPSITFSQGQRGTLLVVPQVYYTFQNNVSNLVVASMQVSPQGLVNGLWVNAYRISGGVAYTAWRTLLSVGVVSVAGSNATPLTAQVEAALVLTPT